MNWTDMAGPVLILVVLSGVAWMMLRPDAPSADEVKTPWLASILSGPFLVGLLAAVALGVGLQNAAQSSVDPWTNGITSGAIVAFLFALLAGKGEWTKVGINLLSGLFGVVGLIVTVGGYFSPQLSCSPADIGQRVLGFLLVLTALAVGGAMSWRKGFFSLAKLGPTVLAVFGALEIVEFLSSPLGVALVDLGVMSWLVALVAAFALGFAASIWPEFVITIAGISVAVGSVIGAVAGSTNAVCAPVAGLSGLAPLVGYVAVFIGVRLLTGRLVGRQTKDKKAVKS